MIAFFDIGSTLIEGPAAGPASRLVREFGLGPEAGRAIHRILFTTPAACPEDLASALATAVGVDARDALSRLWALQLEEAYVLPGAREAVGRLREAGIRRAYLSNIWPPFFACFEAQFADEAKDQPLFLSYRTGLMKPDSAFFRMACAGVGVRPEEVVMIGDTYEADMAPALELGMGTVWLLHRLDKEKEQIVGVLNGRLAAPGVVLGSIAELGPEHVRAAR